MNKWLTAVLLLGLILTGAFLRVYHLGTPSFWVDEVNSVYAAQNYLDHGKMELPSGMTYQRARLHTYSVAFMYRFFDVNEFTSRLPSAVFGILSIFIVYLLGCQLGGPQTGLMAAFLMAFSHFEIGWSRVTRMYSLLQLLTLLSSWFFLKGFEPKAREVRRWYHQSLYVVNVGAALGLILLAALRVHYLALFLLPALAVYAATGALYQLFASQGLGRWVNKYSVSTLIVLIAAAGSWFFVPAVSEKTAFFLNYTPSWAGGLSTAQNKNYLFEFLISPMRFPLAAFFFIGAAQSVIRRQRRAWFYGWHLIVPLLLLSFVFTHRKPTYLFYVYPYFLLISAYGFVNLIQGEWDWLKTDFSIDREWVKKTLLFIFALIFILAPWLRVSVKIPWMGDGTTNMAVTHDEWREAVQLVQQQRQPDDLIVSSLPQVSCYYGLASDYAVNQANLIQSTEKEFVNEAGCIVDVYAGVPFVVDTMMLDSLIHAHKRGWILMTRFHYNHDFVVPAAIQDYLSEQIPQVMTTKKSSVYIFYWQRREEDA